jgi:IS5 family transposase
MGEEGRRDTFRLQRDEEYKCYAVTGAAAHDSEPYPDVLPAKPAYADQEAFGDSAYSSKEIDTKLKERGYVPLICEKGYRNKPLTQEQKKLNQVKSSVRCRIEHIFGAQKMRMGNEILRSIGFVRARFWIGMRNLMDNMSRFVSLRRSLKGPKQAKAG